jgi:hypothetical protein
MSLLERSITYRQRQGQKSYFHLGSHYGVQDRELYRLIRSSRLFFAAAPIFSRAEALRPIECPQECNMPDEQFALHYIDKLHTTLLETGKVLNRLTIVITGGSIALIALASGIVSVEQKLSILGATISMPPSLIVLLGVCLLALLFVHFVALINHEERIGNSILRLYGKLGFHDSSMSDVESNPLEYPNVITTAVSAENVGLGPARWLAGGMVILALLILPFAADVYACYRLALVYGPAWWLISVGALCFISKLLYVMAAIRQS